MTTIRLSDLGILPDTDITLTLFELFKKYSSDTEFVFENADYFFSPSELLREDLRVTNSDIIPYRSLAVFMKNMKNCTLLGNGARLWFSGQVQAFTLDHCENVTVDGFTVNWKKPLVAEGRVLSRDGSLVDVFIDPERFPHKFENGRLLFDVGADEWYDFTGRSIVFEPHSLRARRGVADVMLSPVEALGEGVYRMKSNGIKDIRVGDLINLRHNSRIHAGFFLEKCTDVTLSNVTVHSCGGLGCVVQFCHNFKGKGVHFIPDFASGRLVSSGRDDGFQIVSCSGEVCITECTFHALMDDPINVHGCCVSVGEVLDSHTLRCRFMHPQAGGFHYWAECGDEIAFIVKDTMETVGKATAAGYRLEDTYTFLLTLSEPLPDALSEIAASGGLALDNLTHTPSFICSKNRFGSCRARGLLVSTPRKVVIRDNYFESSGSAILISGDSNGWFESGACHDVEITRNVFTDACMGSSYEFCEGVISICPIIPKPDAEKPYHRGIRITDNVFDAARTPVLYAFSCDGLTFCHNRIFSSPSLGEVKSDPSLIRLSYCRDVKIGDNDWVGDFGCRDGSDYE